MKSFEDHVIEDPSSHLQRIQTDRFSHEHNASATEAVRAELQQFKVDVNIFV